MEGRRLRRAPSCSRHLSRKRVTCCAPLSGHPRLPRATALSHKGRRRPEQALQTVTVPQEGRRERCNCCRNFRSGVGRLLWLSQPKCARPGGSPGSTRSGRTRRARWARWRYGSGWTNGPPGPDGTSRGYRHGRPAGPDGGGRPAGCAGPRWRDRSSGRARSGRQVTHVGRRERNCHRALDDDPRLDLVRRNLNRTAPDQEHRGLRRPERTCLVRPNAPVRVPGRLRRSVVPGAGH